MLGGMTEHARQRTERNGIMERLGVKTRDIRFFSAKNDCIVCVHSRQARDYAKYLEDQSWVAAYEPNFPLNADRFAQVLPVDIRPDYFHVPWSSDFFLTYADGRKGARELAQAADLRKRAVVERLELSRRYWKAFGIDEWKVVLTDAGN